MITQDQTTVFCEKCQSDSIPQLYFTFLGGGFLVQLHCFGHSHRILCGHTSQLCSFKKPQ